VARPLRIVPGDWIFHVMNRANGRGLLFERAECYRDFLSIVADAIDADAMRVLAYCLMPNHWHFLLWPRRDADLSRFLHRITSQHSNRWHLRNGTSGRGHLYKGRFKSVPIEGDRHLLTALRYVEANALRAELVARAEDWPWCSAPEHGAAARIPAPGRVRLPLEAAPVALPGNWSDFVNERPPKSELAELRARIRRDSPYGSRQWTAEAAASLRLDDAPKRRGRPRKNQCQARISQV
jgi:putative transposase